MLSGLPFTLSFPLSSAAGSDSSSLRNLIQLSESALMFRFGLPTWRP